MKGFTLMIFLMLFSILNGNLRETVRYENYLQNQLENYLSKVLPPKTFLVSVNVQISKNRKQEVTRESSDIINKEDNREPVFYTPSNGNTQTQNNAAEGQAPPIQEEILPGLEVLSEETPPKPVAPTTSPQKDRSSPPVVFSTKKSEQQEKSSREYAYVDEIVIEAVDVQIILDNEISADTVRTIRQVISDKLDSAYQDKAAVNFVSSSLDTNRELEETRVEEVNANELENQTLIEEFNRLREDLVNSENKLVTFKDYLDNYGFVFYLLLGLVFLLLILFIFFFFIWFLSKLFNKESPANPTRDRDPPPRDPNLRYSYAGIPNDGGIEPVIDKKINLEMARLKKERESEEKIKASEQKIKALEEEKKKELAKEREKIEEEKKKLQEQKLALEEGEKKSEQQNETEEKKTEENLKKMKFDTYVGEENEFIDLFLEDLLTGRKYILNLNEKEYLDLVHSFSNENVRKIFADLMGEEVYEEESPYSGLNELEIAQSKKRLFTKHLKGLEQYRKILKPQNSDVFGQLSLLKEDEIKSLFSSLGVDAIADLSRFIDNNILKSYLASITDKERQALIKAINLNKELSYQKLADLRNQFREKINEIKNNIFIQKSQKKEIMFNLLKTSQNKKGLLNEIKKDNLEFYENYSSYQTSFEEFLEEDSDLKNKIIDGQDNETLAKAAIRLNDEQASQLFASIPSNRRDLIQGIINTRITDMKREDILEAQEKILNQYRSLKF